MPLSYFVPVTAKQIQEQLSQLIEDAAFGANPSFKGVCCSTELIEPGFLFVAIKGSKVDGHQFIDQAIVKGATGVVVSDEQWHATLGQRGISVFLVTDTRRALSRLAYLFSGKAVDQLSIIGVTGTNGKTTTHWMIDSLLKALKFRTARMGTIGTQILNVPSESSLTTPDPISLHSFFAECVANDVQFVTMEVSSHALEQLRVEDVPFSVAVFTNLSRDHLDYHQDMETYADVKSHLFDLVKKNQQGIKEAVINLDNEWSPFIKKRAQQKGCRVTDLSINDQSAVLFCGDVRSSSVGTDFVLHEKTETRKNSFHIHTGFIGRYNIENLIGAVAAVLKVGNSLNEILPLISSIPEVPGRLERCSAREGTSVFVDYAHTPDALQSALAALRPLCRGDLWVVFGCGGDRDRGKRPLMLKAAKDGADHVMITSDNPRTEDPQRIIDDIVSRGLDETEMTNHGMVEVDRKEAILKVLSMAHNDDVVLIAGKGHEEYQIIGTEKKHFSDQEIVREFYRK